jgi:condensin-2 complex subunit G2
MPYTSKTEEKDDQLAMNALLSAVEGGSDISKEGDECNCRSLIRLFEVSTGEEALVTGCTAKHQKILLHRALQTCHKSQLKRFFSNVRSIVDHIIEKEAYRVTSSNGSNNNDGASSSSQDVARSKECLAFFQYVLSCVQSVINGRIHERQQDSTVRDDRTTKPLRMLPQVLDVTLAMHDILFALHACGESAASTTITVLNLCEAWWLANGECREALIVQCLPLLVLRACEEHDCFTNKAHIQRLYKLRDAFHCIDFTDPSSDSLRKLVLRLASNPLCLKLPEGKKLLSSLLQDVDLVKDLHLSFRAQIPTAKVSVLHAYGEIYHRAWRDSKESPEQVHLEDSDDGIETRSIRHAIEHEVLQELMYAVIHIASPKTFQSIVAVLEPIHLDKKNREVANMIYRLYNPILWRSLRAANPRVRRNAVTMLEKIFPLHDPFHKHGPHATKDAVLKGTKALRDALVDGDPNVRVAALFATGNVCAVFWEALPPEEIRTLLSRKFIGPCSALLIDIAYLSTVCRLSNCA